MKFPLLLVICGAVSSAGIGPLYFVESKVNAAICQDIMEHIMLLSAEELNVDADFIFQQDLAPAHTAKSSNTWFNTHVP